MLEFGMSLREPYGLRADFDVNTLMSAFGTSRKLDQRRLTTAKRSLADLKSKVPLGLMYEFAAVSERI
ncbi:MAG: hypothetical protein COB93_06975, partial [Sneathiella sp.]